MRLRHAKAPKSDSGQDFCRLSGVIKELAREGWCVGQHHVRHAIAVGAVDAPPIRGGWRIFSQHHIDQLRDYLTLQSRQTRGGSQ